MKGKLREIRPGEVFYRFGDKVHFIGIASHNEDVFVFWSWNKWKNKKYYLAIPARIMEIEWRFLEKKKRNETI